MKKQTLVIILLVVLAISCLALTACTGPEGPIGPQGEQGIQGPQGQPGQDGTDGITPQLKTGEDNYWYASYDNGATWTSLGVKATGGDSVLEHTWEKIHTVVQPDCLTMGKDLCFCVDCGLVSVVTTQQGDHSYNESVVAPNCTSQGYTLHTCNVCGEIYKDNFTNIDENNHADSNNDGLCDNCQYALIKVTGECHYVSYGIDFGCKVDVTVQGNIITAIKLYTDEETGWIRTYASNPNTGWTGFEAIEAAYEEYLNKFVGRTVAEVKAIVATASANGQTVSTAGWAITGGTQSSARIIVAIQDALSKLDA